MTDTYPHLYNIGDLSVDTGVSINGNGLNEVSSHYPIHVAHVHGIQGEVKGRSFVVKVLYDDDDLCTAAHHR